MTSATEEVADVLKSKMKGIEMKNLKMIGLAIMAVLAVSAVAASAATAAEYHTSSGSGTSFFTGVQEGNQVFTAGATVSCTGVTAEGSFSGTAAKTLEAKNVKYTGCTVAGQAATVEMNECWYVFGQPTGASSPFTISPITVKCPAGKTIVIKATTAGCTITVGEQTPTSTSTATNNGGSPETVSLKASLSGITSTSTGGVCGTKGTTSTATYAGNVLVKGYSNSTHTTQVNAFIS